MKFHETTIDGAWLIETEPHEDERGYFARTWSVSEFAKHGLSTEITECSISENVKRGTLRGMHYQVAPHEEVKVVSCIRGHIFDAIIDLRPDSPTYLSKFTTNLSLDDGRSLYVPAGVAHGFMTLEDHSVVQYQIGGAYAPDAARGVRWNDPQFGIDWPLEPEVISDRDAAYKDFAS